MRQISGLLLNKIQIFLEQRPNKSAISKSSTSHGFMININAKKVIKVLQDLLFRISAIPHSLFPGGVFDYSIRSKVVDVSRHRRRVFSLYDRGPITRMRAKTFELKEPETLQWLESLDPDTLLIDVGANIGIYSLYAAKLVKEIIAVEPDPINSSILYENIGLNKLTNIRIVCAALFSSNDLLSIIPISTQPGRAESSLVKSNTDNMLNNYSTLLVPSIILTDCIDLSIHAKIALKIDTDGNELQIIDSLQDLLCMPQTNRLIIELDKRFASYSQSLDFIVSCGFTLQNALKSKHGLKGRNAHIVNHIFTKKLA